MRVWFAIFTAVFLCAQPLKAQAQTKACPVAGDYLVTGQNTGASRQYYGEAVITDTGSGCNMRWLPPNTSEGSGSFADGALTIHYVLGGGRGVVRYELSSSGELAGVFWPEGQPTKILGSETLRRKGASTQPAVQPAQSLSRPAQPASQPASKTGTTLEQSIDSLIAYDARGWALNRYDRGSVRNLRMLSQSNNGADYQVQANYTYNNGSPGWVKLRFVNNKFSCIEFWDFAGDCRALLPDRTYYDNNTSSMDALFGGRCHWWQSDQSAFTPCL